jgi:hypothetical protein
VEPPVLSEEFAQYLRMTKRDLFDSGASGELTQTGMAYVGEPINVPPVTVDTSRTGPSIDMFVIDGATGSCTPTGTNAELNDAWLPTVEALATTVLSTVGDQGVKLTGDLYVTTSITPLELVSENPHFDDDQFQPDHGVGLAAIVADQAGPHIAYSPLAHEQVRAPHPLVVTPEHETDFHNGNIVRQSGAAHRVVVFPQFGQLHAGPGNIQTEQHSVRHLLVLRAATRR